MQMAGESPQNMAALQKVLEPMRVTIQDQPFLGGEEPNFADFAVAGAFAVRSILVASLFHRHDCSIQTPAFIGAVMKRIWYWCHQ